MQSWSDELGGAEAPLLVVVGPTASGKTELAVRIAERVGGEIISADSVQVYRHFELGTGKPSAEERARAPHHLIDVTEPEAPLDAASWARLADASISELRARGKVPVVCGGSFLWVRALVHGLSPAPPADGAVRERHQRRVEAEGRAALHAELQRVDPESAARLNPNDFVRVSRALEVYELTGKPQSAWHAEHGFKTRRHQARLVGLLHERSALDARIMQRVRAMLASGWIDEVRDLLARGYGPSRPMGSVGYRQIAELLTSGVTCSLEELSERIYIATRVFARRQRTWLRDEPVEWLTPEQARQFTA